MSAPPSLGILVLRLGDLRCGLRASDVVEVLPAVRLAPLPGAPPIVEGLADVRGALMPVVDLRPRLALPPKPTSPSDHLVVTRARGRPIALRVDRAESFTDLDPAAVVPVDTEIPGVGLVSGAARMPDGLVLIHDPTRFLSEAEEMSLAEAMQARQG